jgi:hypothetical protein
MKKQLFALLTILGFTILACNFSASTANIADAKMAKDPDGQQVTTAFAQADPFYALVQLRNAPADTTVKAVWFAVEAEGTDPNFKIDETSLTSGDDDLQFSLTNDGPWPIGTYKVELYLNDELDRTLEFSVDGQ